MATADGGPTVLVVDDDAMLLEAIALVLRTAGFVPVTAHGGKAALEQLAEATPDLVLTDVRMPGVDGVQILEAARARDAEVPVVLMTAQASLQTAMQAVNAGAYYYLQKPFRNEDLLAIMRRAAEHRQLRTENQSLRQAVRRQRSLAVEVPVGSAAVWREVLRLAEAVAPTDSTILLTGESGTGKEVVARFIHALSPRAEAELRSINCGALPEGLLESELFGHVRGAFTGAVRDTEGLFRAAAGGSLLLDEIGETTPATQVKLLRVLQQREVIPVGATTPRPIDARIIAATNRDLEDEIREGRFRQDLFYRLNVIALHLPPLRDRADDIPLLADHFLHRTAEARGVAPKRLSDAAAAVMYAYPWPGNVRELENAMERALVLTPGEVIEVGALPAQVAARPPAPVVAAPRALDNPTLETIERAYIFWVLQQEKGNKTRAAEVLGIDPSTLHRKLARYDGAR